MKSEKWSGLPALAALLLAGCEARQEQPRAAETAGPAAETARPAAESEAAPAETASPAAQAPAAGGSVSACLVQDGTRLPAMRLRAVGTEPFWGAAIEGRCVTYSTPEDIDGTRIWTKFDGSRDRGVWTGFYQDRDFVLRTYPDRDCSDGMSDTVYPVRVTLVVAGEERVGCAEYR